MGEELEKGRRTLAALEESRATMRKTGDEYAGEQRAASPAVGARCPGWNDKRRGSAARCG